MRRLQQHQLSGAKIGPWSTLRVFTPVAFAGGSLLHFDTYDSVQPLFVMLLIAGPMWLLLTLLASRAPEIRWGYSWLVSWYWLCAGISLLLDGPTQVTPGSLIDAEKFYTQLYLQFTPTSLDDLRKVLEGPLAILVWNYFYEWTVNMGGTHLPHIGVSINIFNMAATGVISAFMAIILYGYDRRRLFILFALFTGCGLFILFATLHVRDSFICLIIAALAALWCAFLVRKDLFSMLLIIAATPLFTFALHYLRYDLNSVPIAFAGVGLAALVAAKDVRRGGERLWINTLLVLGLTAVGFAAATVGADLAQRFERGTGAYVAMAGSGAQADSLGMALVVNQPFLLRLIIGPIYVLFMPIPLWGSSLESGATYALAKAIGAVFFYFLVSRLAVTAFVLVSYPQSRRASVLFLFGVFLIFLMAIGATSIESRHIGPFVPLAIVASLAFCDSAALDSKRANYLKMIFLVMIIAHFMWMILKFP